MVKTNEDRIQANPEDSSKRHRQKRFLTDPSHCFDADCSYHNSSHRAHIQDFPKSTLSTFIINKRTSLSDSPCGDGQSHPGIRGLAPTSLEGLDET